MLKWLTDCQTLCSVSHDSRKTFQNHSNTQNTHTTPSCTCRYSEVGDRPWHKVKPNLSFHLYLPASFPAAVTKIFWQSNVIWLIVTFCLYLWTLCTSIRERTHLVHKHARRAVHGPNAPPPLKLSQKCPGREVKRDDSIRLLHSLFFFFTLPSRFMTHKKTPHVFLHEPRAPANTHLHSQARNFQVRLSQRFQL